MLAKQNKLGVIEILTMRIFVNILKLLKRRDSNKNDNKIIGDVWIFAINSDLELTLLINCISFSINYMKVIG